MFLIENITDDTLQTMTLILPDGTPVTMEIYYVPMQYGWFLNKISYPAASFEANGIRITNNPNMLYQWKNLIPFGLACFSFANREPSQQQDFLSGASKLYLLSSDEVQELTEIYSHG